MSASLVGSEMCIRDRLRNPLDPRFRWRMRSLREQPRRAHQSGASKTDICLLYTSDAADDM
eukprot:8707824-Alexandrium_andersonii.AAC.1